MAHGVLRYVMRFSVKYYAAELLNARLFQTPDRVNSIQKEMKESVVYSKDPQTIDSVTKLSAAHLQIYVRSSWLTCPDSSTTAAHKDFLSLVVDPCLRINVATVPDCFADIVAKFSMCIATGQATDADAANIKIASTAIQGRFDGHPLIQGMALQLRRLLDKQSRGVAVCGRRSNESDRETTLIADAGMALAMMCGNKALAREFGIPRSSLCVGMDKLSKLSLPCPALALHWLDKLEENCKLLDQRYVLHSGDCGRRA